MTVSARLVSSESFFVASLICDLPSDKDSSLYLFRSSTYLYYLFKVFDSRHSFILRYCGLGIQCIKFRGHNSLCNTWKTIYEQVKRDRFIFLITEKKSISVHKVFGEVERLAHIQRRSGHFVRHTFSFSTSGSFYFVLFLPRLYFISFPKSWCVDKLAALNRVLFNDLETLLRSLWKSPTFPNKAEENLVGKQAFSLVASQLTEQAGLQSSYLQSFQWQSRQETSSLKFSFVLIVA